MDNKGCKVGVDFSIDNMKPGEHIIHNDLLRIEALLKQMIKEGVYVKFI